MKAINFSPRGCGIGLRHQHYPAIISLRPKVDWFEAVTENYMDTGGRPLHILEKIRGDYPVALHGTALSIGSADRLNQKYLERLKRLAARIDPFLVSDHLCWSGVNAEALHDLLPLPFTEEAVAYVARRVEQVQEFLGRTIVLENVSSYVTYRHSTMPEWEFFTEVARRSGCSLLVDLNNVYVNATNHGFDPNDYLKHIPAELVAQIHLAGHTDMGSFLFDTHSAPVIGRVWKLYRRGLELWGPISTLIEWDENIPPLERLLEEAEKAKVIYNEAAGRVSMNPSTGQDPLPWHPQSLSAALPIEISLPEMQREIQSKILPSVSVKSKNKIELLNPQGGVPGDERMSVYANAYPARIREALGEVYEAVHRALGDDLFFNLCAAYAGRYGTDDYNLNFAGRHLPDFLAASDRFGNFPFLPDIARLEWLIWKAFHAFDEPPLTAGQLADSGASLEDFDRAKIYFQPSVGLIASRWPILEMWLARNQKEEPRIDPLKEAQRILIGRRDDQVRCELLDSHQYQTLEGLIAGRTLGSVCEELADAATEEALPLSGWFARWLNDGLILRCKFPDFLHADYQNGTRYLK